MPLRVFVTGVAGFLGSHLAERFLSEGARVSGNDSLVSGNLSKVPNEVDFYEVDCNDLEGMKGAIQEADVVYHTAALAHEGLSVFAPSRITESNLQATTTTLSAAADKGIDRFIFCSSMARYGAQKPPFTEDMDPDPQDPYGLNKVVAEETTELLAKVHGFDYAIAVPHNIIGPRQRFNDPYRNVAAIFTNRMLQDKQPIIYGDGEQMRCFSYVEDCIQPLMRMAKDDAVVGEVVNIGPDDEFVTINTLAEEIADILDFDLDPIYVGQRPQEVKRANCSADKARELIDYEPQYSLREGLEAMVEWIKERGPREFDYYIDIEIENDQVPETWSQQRI